MHISKYVQRQTVILHQHIAVTPVNIIRMSYNKNKINIHLMCVVCASLHMRREEKPTRCH